MSRDEYGSPYADGLPGHRGIDTQIEAAEAVSSYCGRLQRKARYAIHRAKDRGLTADECAALLGYQRWTIQPRISELKRKGMVVDSGLRRHNITGKRAIVWMTPAFAKMVANEKEAA